MKHITFQFVASFMALFACITASAQTKLPTVYMYGNFGYDYTPGYIIIKDTNGIQLDHIDMKAKFRGSSSLRYTKKNYAVKLLDENNESLDRSLLDMRKDNSWILDAMAIDKARMRNRVAFDIWNDFNTHPYYAAKEPKCKIGIDGKFVEVYINDNYHGLYCLNEKIDRKQLKLKKKDNVIRGLLYKGDNWYGTQFYGQPTEYDNYSTTYQGFESKYPDVEDDGMTDWAPLAEKQDFVNNSTDEMFKEQVADQFDIPVLRDMFIFINVVGAIDNSGKNMFFSIYDVTTSNKLSFTPWDLDSSFGRNYDSSPYPEVCNKIIFTQNIINRLMELNTSFMEETCKRYAQLRTTVLSLDNLKKRFTQYYTLLDKSGAAQRETNKWNGIDGIYLDFAEELKYINDYLEKRLSYLDKTFNYTSNSINILPDQNNNISEKCYNLLGVPVDKHTYKGIMIVNGKKYTKQRTE